MSFRRRIGKFIKTKSGKITIIGTTVFLLIGITALVLGYGLSEGWHVVLAWITSKWAMYFYVGIGLYVIIVLYIVYLSKKYEE